MNDFPPEEERAFLGEIDDSELMVRGLESYICLWYEKVAEMKGYVDNSELHRDILGLEFQMMQVIKDCVERKKRFEVKYLMDDYLS